MNTYRSPLLVVSTLQFALVSVVAAACSPSADCDFDDAAGLASHDPDLMGLLQERRLKPAQSHGLESALTVTLRRKFPFGTKKKTTNDPLANVVSYKDNKSIKRDSVIALWDVATQGASEDSLTHPTLRFDVPSGLVVPSMHLHLLPKGNNTPLIIVAPGGAYTALNDESEGTPVAAWINSIGFHSAVLAYRINTPYAESVADMRRAVQMVRYRANEWGVDPDRIAVIGFSAGAQLAAQVATSWDEDAFGLVTADEKLANASDEVANLSARPDLSILAYGAYLLPGMPAESPALYVTKDTTPAFMWAAEDDDTVPVENTKLYAQELGKAGVPGSQILIYPRGGHGRGLAKDCNQNNRVCPDVGSWTFQCVDWLAMHGWEPKIGWQPSPIGHP